MFIVVVIFLKINNIDDTYITQLDSLESFIYIHFVLQYTTSVVGMSSCFNKEAHSNCLNYYYMYINTLLDGRWSKEYMAN